jgi:cytoskeletal protein RodZ
MAKKTHDILDEIPITNKDYIKRAQAIETQKEIKQKDRLAKKEEKEQKLRRQKREKLVAPILLIISILVALAVRLLSGI